MANETQATGQGQSPLEELLNVTVTTKEEDERSQYKESFKALLKLLKDQPTERVDRVVLDKMIRDLDQKISTQLDQVMHHSEFQRVESAWRGLEYVVKQTRFDKNIKIEMLNVTKEELSEDFNEVPDFTYSKLYKTVYDPYSHYGDDPYGAVIANYEFGPTQADVTLLQNSAKVASVSHAPFIAGGAPSFFKGTDHRAVDKINDFTSHFKSPAFINWNSFRESEDSRYVGLVMPHFLLRMPYGTDIKAKTFDYREAVVDQHDSYLWGNAAFAFATRLTESFAKYGWCLNIIGPNAGGAVEDLKLHQYEQDGQLVTKVPTEYAYSDPQEYQLCEAGFIPLVYKRNNNMAAFFAANSCQSPKFYGQSAEGQEAETNYRLGTKLPYLFLASRFAHYLKVLQREEIGKGKSAEKLRKELNEWIKQYCSDNDMLPEHARTQYPLYDAGVDVEDIPGRPGTYSVKMRLKPYFKYEGASFELSLVGKLDAAAKE